MKKIVCVVALLVAAVGVATAALSAEAQESLVANWSFDEDFTDTSGSGFNLTPYGTGDVLPSIVTGGKIGGAASFDRESSQYAKVSYAVGDMFAVGGDYTYTAWYRLDVADIAGTTQYFLCESGSTTHSTGYVASYGVRGYTWEGVDGYDVGQTYTYTSSGWAVRFPQTDHTPWYHVAVTYNHTTHVLDTYINGALAATLTTTGDLKTNDFLVVGGHRAGTGRNWEGLIDDMAVFDSLLSVNDIQYLAAGNAVVPEPATMCLLALGGLLFVKRK